MRLDFKSFGSVLSTALLVGGAGLWANPSRGSDFHSPRTAALGGSGHAGPMLNDSIYLNPSYVSLLQTYGFAANYFSYAGEGENPNDYHGMGYNLSLQDGRSELFQAGLGLTSRQDAQILNIGASKQVVQRVGVGLGAKYFKPRYEGSSGNWESVLSATALINSWVQLSLTIDNLLETQESKNRGLYREIVLGSKFNVMGASLVYFDPHLTPSLSDDFGYEVGLEVPVMSDLYLRMGGFKNSYVPFAATRGKGFGFGIGWLAPKISLDYGLQHATEPVSAISHVLGMTIFM